MEEKIYLLYCIYQKKNPSLSGCMQFKLVLSSVHHSGKAQQLIILQIVTKYLLGARGDAMHISRKESSCQGHRHIWV